MAPNIHAPHVGSTADQLLMSHGFFIQIKMEPTTEVLLCDSYYCRLCAEENKNGTDIFSKDEDETDPDLSQLVNRYLPLKVEDNGKLPRRICPGCHIQLEATKIFMDLIIDGQMKLREMWKTQQEILHRQEKQRLQLEEALQNVSPNSKVKTYTIQSDETGEKFLIQIISDGPLFPPDHELALKTDGLDKPRRKRGRPPKPPVDPNKVTEIPEDNNKDQTAEDEGEVDNDGRRKRRIRAPTRYDGVVQGKELDKILKDEGVTDDELTADMADIDDSLQDPLAPDQIIGRVETQNGEAIDELIVLNSRSKPRTRPGILKRGRRFQCKICKKEFLHIGRYNLHKKFHKVHFACQENECGFVNDEKRIVEAHQMETGHSGITTAEKVDTIGTVELPGEPSEDIKPPVDDPLSTFDGKYECKDCDKVFSCKQNYEVHLRAVHKQEKPFSCDICNRSFCYANSLRLHYIRHEKEKPDRTEPLKQYSCETCSKVFQHPSSLIYHRDSEHSNGRRFVCNKCNKSFKHRQLLQRHQLVHSDERPHRCGHCAAAFKTRANLLNHQALHTGQRKYVCSQCGQKFAHKTSLTLHQRWHSGQKPYQCDVCNKAFSQKGNLAEHKRIHTGEKPYVCDHCGRAFTTSSQIRLHKKRHTGERPWRCEFCSKTFLHKDTWKCHTRRHLNDRPFKCQYCQRAFTEAWALKKHERLHTGEKPYKCDRCGRGFSDSSNMTKHRRTHNTCNVKEMTVVEILDPSMSVEKEGGSSLQLRQLVDQQGNPISLTTQDGQQVPVVTGGDDDNNIQGLLPDGTLIPIDISSVEDKIVTGLPMLDENGALILSDEMDFLSTQPEEDNVKVPDNTKVENQNTNIQFLSDNGQAMCLVTTFTVDEPSSSDINTQYLALS